MRRAIPVLVAALLLLPLAPAPTAAIGARLPCPDARLLAGIGPVCERADGLIELYTADGRFLGLSHGPDAAPPASIASEAPSIPPACVEDPALDAYAIMIYAIPSDQTDRFPDLEDDVREMVNRTNGRVHAEAASLGGRVDFKLLCDARGLVEVRHEVLPTPAGQASFGTVIQDLQARGYDRTHVKYWIFYDDETHRIPYGGLGNVCDDDRPALANGHNGLAGTPDGKGSSCPNYPMYAATFYLSDFIMLHEAGHTTGAVQTGAPHSSGAYHCNDGSDVMCYGDGGFLGNYTSDVCPDMPWDCNHDDYFHPSPPAGTWLAEHWNLASPLHRNMRVGDPDAPPVVRELACRRFSSDPPNGTPYDRARCTFGATSATSNVSFEVHWPGGATTNVSRAPPGRVHLVVAEITNATPLQVTVVARDVNGRESSASFDEAAVPPDLPPTMASFACAPSIVFRYDMLVCRVRGQDDGDVRYRIDDGEWIGHVLPWDAPTPAGWDRPFAYWAERVGERTINATVEDERGQRSAVATASFLVVDNDRPRLTFRCEPWLIALGEPMECTIEVADDSEGVHVDIDWGDGNRTRVPESGDVRPPANLNATHAYTVEGNYYPTAKASDNETYSASSPTAKEFVLVNGTNAAPRMSAFSCEPAKPRVGETVRCLASATDPDSSSISIGIEWGDGAGEWFGNLSSGAEVEALHAFGSNGSFRARATPYDAARSGIPISVTFNVTQPLCEANATGTLLAGLRGLDQDEVTARSHAVPASCKGFPYRLHADTLADVGLCFAVANGTSLCHRVTGDETGNVPAAATSVRVILYEGAIARYDLTYG